MQFLKQVLSAVFRGELTDYLATLIAPKVGIFARIYKDPFQTATAIVFLITLLILSLVPGLQSQLKSKTLDIALSWRLSSPEPDPKVIIIDIDEKSLALLATEHGRWPWSRALVAEALATLSEFRPKSVLLNIMYSDYDIRDKTGDEAFEQVAALLKDVTYPIIRLAKENDDKSQVTVDMLNGVVTSQTLSTQRTIAVLYTIFPSTHDKLGLINLRPDRDSVVRSYPVIWQEDGFNLRSAVLLSAMKDPAYKGREPNTITLNWRNKSGKHKRVSFSDLFDSEKVSSFQFQQQFKDAHLIVGVSAPGISVLKSTPVSPIVDDNEILATAIDDLINDTYLRLLPVWFSSLLAATLILAVIFSLRRGANEKVVSRWFSFGQLVMVVITVISTSYTNYLIDLSDTLVFVTLFFTIIRLGLLLERNSYRGVPKFVDIRGVLTSSSKVLAVGLVASKSELSKVQSVKRFFEKSLGPKNAFFIDNAYSKENLFGHRFADFFFYLNVISNSNGTDIEKTSADFLCNLKIPYAVSMICVESNDGSALQNRVSELLIDITYQLLSKENACTKLISQKGVYE